MRELEYMTIHSQKKRTKYDARVEYRAIQAEVEQMLDQGHSVKAVFEEMSHGGRLTISYNTFCEYVRGGGRRPRKGEIPTKNQKRPGLPQRQSSKPRSGPSGARGDAADGPFVYDKNIDISELI